jgi:hypothetical protein
VFGQSLAGADDLATNKFAVSSVSAGNISGDEIADLVTAHALHDSSVVFGANALILTGADVNDMSGFNLIRIGSTSADGRVWTNVGTGTALALTSPFHQLVVDDDVADVINLASDNGTWSNAGTVNDGTSNYVVWQNNTTASQVLVKSGMEVNSNVSPAAFEFNTDSVAMDYSHSAIQADLAAGQNSKAPAVLSFEDEGFEAFASMQGLTPTGAVLSATDLAIAQIGMGDDGLDDEAATSKEVEPESATSDALTLEVVTAKTESSSTAATHDETAFGAIVVTDPTQHLIDQTALNTQHNG